MGVGLNSAGDRALSCWELVLHVWKEVRLLVELVGEGGGWSLGDTGEGTKVKLEVGLNSRREVLSLTDSKLLIRCMQGITGLA